MIEEVGVVVDVEGSKVIVETRIKSTCGSCQAQSNCGTGTIARALTPRPETIAFESELALAIGNKVRIGIPEEALLKASLWLYITPLVVLVASAIIFSIVLPLIGLTHELWLVVSSLGFTFASFAWLSAALKKTEASKYHPRLLGVISEPQRIAITTR
jgi:sigma-E factor negative regulatory protein RseC